MEDAVRKVLMREALDAYEDILAVANRFLKLANTVEISTLQEFDPSLEEIAANMDFIADMVVRAVNEIDPHLAHQSVEYVFLMKRMARAIMNGDEEALSKATEELEAKPFVLP